MDTDWAEICEEFNLNMNADTLRKAGVGIKLADDAGMINVENVRSLQTDAESYIERQKMRDIVRQANTLYRTESRSELLRETIREAIKDLPKMQGAGRLWMTPECEDKEGKDKCLVLALGDFHYGADIHIEGLRGEVINEFNHEVFEERMDKLLQETINIIEREHLVYVHVCLVGDLIDGMLRQSQLMRLEYGIIESTMRLSEYLAWWLDELSEYAFVDVHAAMGNHSEIRPLKSKSREFEDENLEKIIMWYLSARLEDNANIYVQKECLSRVFIDIKGFSFLLLHGDGEKDIVQLAHDAVNQYGHGIDFFVCGHRHKEQEWPAGLTDSGSSVIIRVPSICGVDKYAQSRGYNGKPGATAMVIERGYGRRCVYPIQL